MNTPPNLRITKYEQSALVITTATTTIAIDFGTLTPRVPALHPLDGTLVSHVHGDHFHPAHLTALGVPIWAAAEVVERLADTGQHTTLLSGGTNVVIGDFDIEAVEVNHGSISAPISNLGFLLRAAGHTIFFAGDMAVSSPLPATAIDVLFVPVGGGKVFNAEEAAAYVRSQNHHGIVVPLHYHGNADPRSAEEFRTRLGNDARVHVLEVGATLEVGK